MTTKKILGLSLAVLLLLITLSITVWSVKNLRFETRKQAIQSVIQNKQLSPGDFVAEYSNFTTDQSSQNLITSTTTFRNWGKINTIDAPPGRHRAALVFFPPSGKLILFGGWGGYGVGQFDDTWEFDGVRWSQLDRRYTGSPGALHGHQMVYEEANQRIILFGGLRCTPSFSCWETNDTYHFARDDFWERQMWGILNPPTSPPPRQGHAMVYDSLRSRILMFGGATGRTLLNDTWEFDGSSWREVNTPTAPSTRFAPAMSFDSKRGKVILHGGYNWNDYFLTDTWEYDSAGQTWKKVFDRGVDSDGGGAIAYDPQIEKTVLFGGHSAGFFRGIDLDRTWEYDGSTWQEIYPQDHPLSLSKANMTYFPNIGKLVLFGGAYWNKESEQWLFLSDTWAYITQSPPHLTPSPSPTIHPKAGCYKPCIQDLDCKEGLICGVDYCHPGIRCQTGPLCFDPKCPHDKTCKCLSPIPTKTIE